MTFTRLAKLLALVMVAFALWRARPPAAPAHVVVLALPGAAPDVLAAGLDAAWGAEADASEATNGAVFWRRLLTVEDDVPADSGDIETLWTGSAAPARAVAVPARLFGSREQVLAAEGAFLGSSSGAVVEAADVTAGRLPPPYDRALDAITSTTATLRRDEWSDWIEVEAAPVSNDAPPAGVGHFQFVRVSDTAYFFSPTYQSGAATLVASPFLRGLDRDLRPLAASHVIELARRRLAVTRDLFANADDGRPVVVFDTVAEDAQAVFAPDSLPSSTRDQVRDEIAERIASAKAAVGPEGVVVVVGGPSSQRDGGEKPWCRVLDSAGGSGGVASASAADPVGFESLRALVRYASGVSLSAQEKPLLPAPVAARHPVKPRVAEAAAAASRPAPELGWSVSTLESLPGAVGRGH